MSFNRFLEKTITKSQRCQRNWDLSRSIPVEDIKTMKTSITQCSSKQNRVFYKAKFITNRDIIEKLYNVSDGNTWKSPDGVWHRDKNPQLLANLVVAFIRDRDPSEGKRNLQEREAGKHSGGSEKEHPLIARDEQVALGIAAGYLTLTANMLGYSSGCCQCGKMKEMQEILGLSNGEDEKVLLTMGIGYPQPGVSRLIHHETGRRMNSHNKNILVEDIN